MSAAVREQATRSHQVWMDLRQQEAEPMADAVDRAWPHLGSGDRWIRRAARDVLEGQPVAQWQQRALNEVNVDAGVAALLSLARRGDRQSQPELLRALAKFPLARLTERQQLQKLRALEITVIRHGRPETPIAALTRAELAWHQPATDETLERDRFRVLALLESPVVTARAK